MFPPPEEDIDRCCQSTHAIAAVEARGGRTSTAASTDVLFAGNEEDGEEVVAPRQCPEKFLIGGKSSANINKLVLMNGLRKWLKLNNGTSANANMAEVCHFRTMDFAFSPIQSIAIDVITHGVLKTDDFFPSQGSNWMENIYGSVMEPNETGRAGNMEHFKCHVDEMSLEQRFTEVEHFYSNMNKKQSNTPRGNSAQKDSEKEKQIANFKKRQQDASQREAAAAKRMQDLMRQFGTILRQITQPKWAGPFMQPVDVEGLGLHD
nr:transcription factor GTE1-like [Ipomoea batatas]